jgi:hypothetical protein
VCPVHAIAEGWAVLAFLEPRFYDIGDKFLLVASDGKICFVEVAGYRPYTGQIRNMRYENTEWRKIAIINKF